MRLGRLASKGDLVSRLRAVIRAKDEQIAVLTADLEALDRERRLELRPAEVERRLSMDSTDSGTPSSKERIGARPVRRVPMPAAATLSRVVPSAWQVTG
jgi:hypothetical protein